MFPQIQNVHSVRELFNPNPCRDMWESQQYSQAASGSQGSQHSSMELFSQSRNSQQKGNGLYDGRNTSTSSQQMNEDDPMKYYMKYMSKPPLFPDLDKQLQQKNQTLNYKDFVEIQKKRAAEKDEKDVLDNFITLLKDYTKEVKSALDSFKSSIDITLTEKAEQMACVADQSTTLIAKLKEDLLDNFSDLRKELKENQTIKEEVAKQNEKLAEQSTEVKMLRAQLEDYRMRERKALEKEASYLEREAQLLEKLREVSIQQQALTMRDYMSIPQQSAEANNSSSTQACRAITPPVEQPNNLPVQHSAQKCNDVSTLNTLVGQPSSLAVPHFVPNFNGFSRIGQPSYLSVPHQPWNLSHVVPSRLHHPPQLTESVRAPCEATQVACSGRPFLEMEYRPQSGCLSSASLKAAEEAINLSEDNQTFHAVPLRATVAPMQLVQSALPMAPSQEDTPVETRPVYQASSDCGSFTLLEKTVRMQCTIVPTRKEMPEFTIKSPNSQNVGLLVRNGRTKQSPVATVLPQVHVKTEHAEDEKKDGAPCPKRKAKEDPLNIFMFDLTNSSPDGSVYTNSERQESQGHKEPKDTLERGKQGNKAVASSSYYTRSTGRLNRTHCPASKDRNMSPCQASRAESTVNNVAHKVYKVKSSALKRPARYCNNGTDSDDELSLQENTSKRSGSTGLTTANKDKNGTRQKNYGGKTTVTSKLQDSHKPFRRNVTSKRTLSFHSSVFDVTDDSLDIQQITECIRRHAQERKMSKRPKTA